MSERKAWFSSSWGARSFSSDDTSISRDLRLVFAIADGDLLPILNLVNVPQLVLCVHAL